MIEIKKEDGPRGGYELYVNGERVSEEDAYLSSSPDFWVSIYDVGISIVAMGCLVESIPQCIKKLKFDMTYGVSGLEDSIVLRRDKDDVIRELAFEMNFDMDEWKRSWSIREFAETLERMSSRFAGWIFELQDELIVNGFYIKFPLIGNATIKEQAGRRADELEKIIQAVESELMLHVRDGSLNIL